MKTSSYEELGGRGLTGKKRELGHQGSRRVPAGAPWGCAKAWLCAKSAFLKILLSSRPQPHFCGSDRFVHAADRIENASIFVREDFFRDFSISENVTLALRESLDSEGLGGLGAIRLQ